MNTEPVEVALGECVLPERAADLAELEHLSILAGPLRIASCVRSRDEVAQILAGFEHDCAA